jgi:hypothetical protein
MLLAGAVAEQGDTGYSTENFVSISKLREAYQKGS